MDIRKLDDAVNDILDVLMEAESMNLIDVYTADKLINSVIDVNNEIKNAA